MLQEENDALLALFPEARDPATPPERLSVICTRVYRQGGTTAFALVQALGSNPSLEWRAALLLLDRCPRQLLENPALPLWSWEIPDFWTQATTSGLVALAKECLPLILEKHQYLIGPLLARNSKTIHEVLLLNKDLPYELLVLLGNARIARQTSYQIITHPLCDAGLLDMLAHVDDKWMRGHVARHEQTSYATLLYLARHGDQWVRGCLLSHPRCSDEIRNIIGINV